MSIWGDLDTDEIPDDPNFVAAGTYFATCTSAKLITDKEETDKVVAIAWTWIINEPESEYHNFPLNEYIRIPRSKTQLKEDGDERHTQQELWDGSKLKKRLKEAFGLSPEEVQAFADPDSLVGQDAYVTSTVGTNKKDPNDTRKFVNVSKAISPEMHAEEMAKKGSELRI